MERRNFLKNIGLVSTGLPLLSFKGALGLSVTKVRIYDNYVRGLPHYGYEKIKSALQAGTELRLVREAENLHDSFAVQVYFGEIKLGYLPAYENIVLANMIDAGIALETRVSAHDLQENMYHRLALEAFAELVISTPQTLAPPDFGRADNSPDLYRNTFI